MPDIIKNKTEVIVVGGGPAGISCALTIARAGKNVILIERGSFAGSKNVFGGAIYAKPTREIFPDFEKNAPIERKTIEHKYMILGEDDSTVVSYKKGQVQCRRNCLEHASQNGSPPIEDSLLSSQEPHETRSNKQDDDVSYSVIRGKFDRWMAEEAKKEGVILVEETVVRELIVENEQVVGVKTELEDYYADIVVLADGVNSLLAKQIGLRETIEPKDVALSVKEVIKLDKEKINDRFNVEDGEGCVGEIFGGPMLGMLGLGFLYTNKNSVTIGLGVTINELCERNIKPYELLDQLKSHPTIAPLIKGGELLEYSAHLIPEGGYNKVPTLAGAGVMVVGDAAMLVNNLHWEGTNLAMISGKLAGETAVVALGHGDFSEKMLARYQKELENSFIMKDLKTYRNLMDELHERRTSFLDYYLRKVNAFFEMFTSTDGIPKRKKYRGFIGDFLKGRKFSELFKDAFSGIKLLWSILIK